MQARIYSPAPNAMQTGPAKAGIWIVEYEPAAAKRPDALMGWNGSSDTAQQIRVKFATKADAVGYAKRHGLQFQVSEPAARKPAKPRQYADRFKWDRVV